MLLNTHFEIDGKKIGDGEPAYIIAEMSANHAGDINRAIELIHAAKEAGADAIKLQTYTAGTLTIDVKSDFYFIKKGAWAGQYLYDLYAGAFMPWEWHERLVEVAKSIGISIFSTPFDPSAVELLTKLDMPAFKIASPEIIDLPLIRLAARAGKPLIISTGNATLAEINEAVAAAAGEGAKDICILKCTSEYPAPPEKMNLRTIGHLKEGFGCPVGLSDHTLGIAVPVASVALGANMIEKHFVMSRDDNSVDSFFSLTPDELKEMVKSVRTAEKALGAVEYPIASLPAQRSLIAVRDIAQNELFSDENVKSLRPGGGILPKHIDSVIGRRANVHIKKGQPLAWPMIGGF